MATSRIAPRIFAAFFALIMMLSIGVQYASAAPLSDEQKALFRQNILYFDAEQSAFCNLATTDPTAGGSNTNIDYAGNPILSDAQLAAIGENTPTYQQAAQQVDIPWQMIAVIHLRETGLKRINPGNGQGIYQFVSGLGGPYPTGEVSDAEFLRQTILAAEFIKGKAAVNYTSNRNLTATSGPEVIKDTFFGYNGRSSKYEDQAAALGYDPNTQGYEGSPYVMNKADAKRDPDVNTTTWGQVKRDFGPIEYPANGDYGAFVVYAALAGIATGGNCSTTVSGTVREKVVALARQELALWQNGELVPGTGDNKYSRDTNPNVNWCAYFISYLFQEAGYPIKTGNDGMVPSVTEIMNIGKAGGNFSYHEAGSYVPKVGDIVIQKGNGVSHTNLVVGVEDGTGGLRITVIGGNQGGDGGGFNASKVTEYTYTGTSNGTTTGYVSYPVQ